jgi:hypothetical protein
MTVREATEIAVGQHQVYHNIFTNADGTPQRWRINGRIKLWKKRPDFRIPIKRGLREYGYLTDYNHNEFSLTEEKAMCHMYTGV